MSIRKFNRLRKRGWVLVSVRNIHDMDFLTWRTETMLGKGVKRKVVTIQGNFGPNQLAPKEQQNDN
jgi:hypothetical protein